jgi:16S rRNA A1518/A1519 N6-dimethyltransferase RsmA/KsgA/DIM1 with predicted DNA glycosylase/AP lyase activity
MNNPLTNIVQDWIRPLSNVIDFGCGDGSLLQELREHKQTIGYGIEIDPEGIVSCL